MNEQSIFAAALAQKTATDRKAFLDEACGQNADLRAQVEQLLAAHAEAGSFLEHPPAGMEAPVKTVLAESDSDTGPSPDTLSFLEPCEKPDRIGKIGIYEVIEVVGQGGMGLVLRALDTKLSRIVAVKVMARGLAANPMAVRRFLREAQSAAAVVHDHVVTIHAVDDRSQPPYLVMEFVQGQTLQQKIDREGALPLRHILRIGSQTAAGLAAAHRTGLIHRDVKPANILLENGVERVKITDFGLARATDDVEMTKSGMIAGTPQYMSPEQANGGHIDFRSDLFSLGSVLYTMCTGRAAFRAETTMATLRRVSDDMPRPVREVNPEIPEWLDAIVKKLLAKNPDDRFQSAAVVAELLSQHLADVQNPSPRTEPVAGAKRESGSPPAAPRRKSMLSRSSMIGGAIALAFLTAIAIFGPDMMRFAFDQGTLQLIGAEGVSQARIEIDRDGKLVDVLTFPSDRQINLVSGDYQLDVTQVP
ncbi:MAG TPA: serine/threonine-protein kinase, partial [Planctomycetaceae bacterium]